MAATTPSSPREAKTKENQCKEETTTTETTTAKAAEATVDTTTSTVAAAAAPVETAEDEPDKATSIAIAAALAQESTVATTSPPTYTSTKNSPAYLLAKNHLTEGDFESALETIAEAIPVTLSLLPEPDDLHESIAPLYYLNGTTILYSVEESEGAESAVMVGQQQQHSGEGSSEEQQQAAAANTAEDLQIAWENLESARSILTTLTTSSSFLPTASPQEQEKALDLAQIHHRLGDLQRANGNYVEALEDYNRALEIREKLLGRYHRKIADVHYSLAMVCLLLSAEGEKELQAKEDPQAKAARELAKAMGADSGEEKKVELSEEEIMEYREKSMLHYLACGRAFGGIIAEICGVGVESVVSTSVSKDSDDEDDEDDEEDGGKGKGKGKAKSCTPTENKNTSPSSSVFRTSSLALQSIRSRVKDLKPTNPTDADKLFDLKELLDEIQETMDTTEEDMKGLVDVSKMKAKAEADLAAEEKREGDSKDAKEEDGGATTTIGFGAPSTTTTTGFGTASATTIGFGASASASTAAAAAPMMVVKKKKKRELPQASSSEKEEVASDAKRSRTD